MNQKILVILCASGIIVGIIIGNELYKNSQFGKRQKTEADMYAKKSEEEIAKIKKDIDGMGKSALKDALKDLKEKGIIEKWTPDTLRNPFNPTEK